MIIVLYHHKHGTDAWLAPSHAEAVRQCVGEVLGSINELEGDERTAVLTQIAEGNFADALRTWRDARDESFETMERSVPDSDDDDNASLRATARELLAKTEAP